MIALSDIRGQQQKIWKIINGYSENTNAPNRLTYKKLHSLAGILNQYIYCILKEWGAIEKQEGLEEAETARYALFPERLELIKAKCDAGQLTINAPCNSGFKMLEKFWPEARKGERPFRNMRAYMRDHLELFEFEDQLSGRDTHGESCTPPLLKNVNLYKMLMVYEVVLKEIIDQYNGTQDPDGVKLDVYDVMHGLKFHGALPKHKGMTGVLLFNAVFGKICQFGRTDTPEAFYYNPALSQQKEKPEFVPDRLMFTAYKRWKWWTAPQWWVEKQPKIVTAWNQMTLQWERLISRDRYVDLFGEADPVTCNVAG